MIGQVGDGRYPAHSFKQASGAESPFKELMKSNNLKCLSKTIKVTYDAVEEENLAELNETGDGTAIPSKLLAPKYQARELASEAAKLKSLQVMEQVPLDRQVKLWGILSWNTKDGGNMVDDASFLELVGDRVNRAADHCVSARHIMTSKRLNKRVTCVFSMFDKYLSRKKPVCNSFDFYLNQIQNVLTEASIQAARRCRRAWRWWKKRTSASSPVTTCSAGPTTASTAWQQDQEREGLPGPGRDRRRTRNEGKGPGKGGSRTRRVGRPDDRRPDDRHILSQI